MKKNLLFTSLFLLFVSWSGRTFAQTSYYRTADDKKYYIAASYGFGTSRWSSRFQNTFLYNTDGSVLRSGDLKMKAVNPNFNYNFSVCFPIGVWRLGAGICFEKYTMDKLTIISLSDSATSTVNVPNSYVLFNENFWFNKVYGMLQRPFAFTAGKPYGFDLVLCGGFYGYNGLHHLNFFGNDQIARTLFCNVSFIFDYEILPNTRIFIQPMGEYKYFHNNSNEYPSTIIHNIFSASLNFGIRINMAKFHF
jgi:hypothetical protein